MLLAIMQIPLPLTNSIISIIFGNEEKTKKNVYTFDFVIRFWVPAPAKASHAHIRKINSENVISDRLLFEHFVGV